MDVVRGPFARNLLQTLHRKLPGLASHYRGTAQKTRPLNNLVQTCPQGNWMRGYRDNVAYEKALVGGGPHPNERQVVAKVDHIRKP